MCDISLYSEAYIHIGNQSSKIGQSRGEAVESRSGHGSHGTAESLEDAIAAQQAKTGERKRHIYLLTVR